MFMIIFSLFFAFFFLIINLMDFEESNLRDWVRKLRFAREQQPTAQKEATIEETGEKDAAPESTSDSHVSVMLLDPDVLECPTCCEPLKIPIYQCNNGHLACSPCCEKVKNICPSCQLPIGYNRCRAMEKVIEASRVSCTNAKYGCKERASYDNPSSHEKQCLFTPCSCPMRDCNYTSSYKDLYKHVRGKHKDGLIPFVWDFTFVIDWVLSKKITILQEETDGELIVVQVFNRRHGMFISVSCIAPLTPGLGGFSCTLQYATSSIRLKQALVLREIQKVKDERPDDGFMLIPSYMLPSDGSLKMGVCISRGHVHLIHA